MEETSGNNLPGHQPLYLSCGFRSQPRTRRANCSAVFYKNAIDVIDPTTYYLQEKTKNDVSLWHRRVWNFIENKFPLPINTKQITYGDGILFGDSKEDDAEQDAEPEEEAVEE